MANEIQFKEGSETGFTITLASLASSVVGVGRQSTMIDNTTVQAPAAFVSAQVTVGTTPTADTVIEFYLLRDIGTITDDNAGASDAGLTVVNAPLLGTIRVPAATSDTSYYKVFDTWPLGPLGPTWGIAVVNASAATLKADTQNVDYMTYIPEVQ